MNYGLQERYLRSSRIAAGGVVLCVLALAAFCVMTEGKAPDSRIVVFGLIVAAIAISIFYTPDYLHLTVKPDKPALWEFKIRWRLIGCVLVLGLIFSSNVRDVLVCLGATAWLIGANVVGYRLIRRIFLPAYLWLTDLALLEILLLEHRLIPLVGAGLLALAAHLSTVIYEERPLVWGAAVTISGWLVMLGASRHSGRPFRLLAEGLLLATAMGTGWLVRRADRHNTHNIWKAMGELVGFTDYEVGKVWLGWRESDRRLAESWVAAAPNEKDSKALAEWYQQNSEPYMFAISAYNLDYKRIRSNLKVMRRARGACLDYGAGNGEIVLELARRGHPATYYDVEGQSAKFAQYRARKQQLDVKFRFSKETLAANGKFDTIFSLDVLEHIPDLQAELDFLSSLLNPGGVLLFDVPAGSTRSHPMHLNHNVNFRSFLQAKGLREKRAWWTRLPFVKQEKFVFIKPQRPPSQR
jgi:2-polyprenyl-3-methyl-5-hydroxy-6-metoxy-1,4-benzoquinol methylase